MVLDEGLAQVLLLFLQVIDLLVEALGHLGVLSSHFLESLDLLLSEREQVLVTIKFEFSLCLLVLLFVQFLLQLLLLVLKLVLHALDVQLELLLDLDVVSDLSLVLLEHLLVIRGRLIRTGDTL